MTYDDAKKALFLLGYPVDAQDDASTVGPTTRQAIMSFQRDHGLVDHGMLDEETQKKLEAETLGKTLPSPYRDAEGNFDWNELFRFMGISVGIMGLMGVAYELYAHNRRRR